MTTAPHVTGGTAARMIAALEEFIGIQTNFSMRTVQVFLAIATAPLELDISRLAELFDIDYTKARKHTNTLINNGLIDKILDPRSSVGRKVFLLTSSGELLYQRIQECFQ